MNELSYSATRCIRAPLTDITSLKDVSFLCKLSYLLQETGNCKSYQVDWVGVFV